LPEAGWHGFSGVGGNGEALSFEDQWPHTGCGDPKPMVVTSAEKEKLDLTALRRPLAERFEKYPHHLYLALQIKAIDDKIAECDQSIRLARKTRVAK
jgi:hypothetical protein